MQLAETRRRNETVRAQALRRLLAIVVVLGCIGVVAYLWRPDAIERVTEVILGESANKRIAAPAEAKPQPPEVKKAVRRPVSKAAAASVESVQEAVDVGTRPSEKLVLTVAGPSNVKVDFVPVHSSNSSDSPILFMLRKGDRVETKLEIIDFEGRWSLIRTPDFPGSGFVRTESLQRSPAAGGTN